MTTNDEQYVLSEDEVRAAWVDREYEFGDTTDRARSDFDRFLARVHRDAAREALDGMAEAMQDTPGIGPSTKSHRARMRTDIRIYRSRNYPETED